MSLVMQPTNPDAAQYIDDARRMRKLAARDVRKAMARAQIAMEANDPQEELRKIVRRLRQALVSLDALKGDVQCLDAMCVEEPDDVRSRLSRVHRELLDLQDTIGAEEWTEASHGA